MFHSKFQLYIHVQVILWFQVQFGKKTCTSEFFKDYRNCTSPKDDWNLKSLKNSRVHGFFSNSTRNHTLLLINNNIHENIYMQSLLKTPKCFFLSLFPLEIAVSYWRLSELYCFIFSYFRGTPFIGDFISVSSFQPLCVIYSLIVYIFNNGKLVK